MMGERFLVRAPLTAIRVEVDGILLAQDAAVVTVANVETYRGFLSLTPTASPIDGYLDIFVIPGGSKLSVWTRIFKLLLRLPGRWNWGHSLPRRNVRVTANGRTDELTPAPARLAAPGPARGIETLRFGRPRRRPSVCGARCGSRRGAQRRSVSRPSRDCAC